MEKLQLVVSLQPPSLLPSSTPPSSPPAYPPPSRKTYPPDFNSLNSPHHLTSPGSYHKDMPHFPLQICYPKVFPKNIIQKSSLQVYPPTFYPEILPTFFSRKITLYFLTVKSPNFSLQLNPSIFHKMCIQIVSSGVGILWLNNISEFLEIQIPWGKVLEGIGLIIEYFCWEVV